MTDITASFGETIGRVTIPGALRSVLRGWARRRAQRIALDDMLRMNAHLVSDWGVDRHDVLEAFRRQG